MGILRLEEQIKLSQATVAVIGTGGIGSNCLNRGSPMYAALIAEQRGWRCALFTNLYKRAGLVRL